MDEAARGDHPRDIQVNEEHQVKSALQKIDFEFTSIN